MSGYVGIAVWSVVLAALFYWGGPLVALIVKAPAWLPGALDALRWPGAAMMAAGAAIFVFSVHTPSLEIDERAPDPRFKWKVRASGRWTFHALKVSQPGIEIDLGQDLASYGLAAPVERGQILSFFQRREGGLPFIVLNADTGAHAANAAVVRDLARPPSSAGALFDWGAIFVALTGTLWVMPLLLGAIAMAERYCLAQRELRYAAVIHQWLLAPLKVAAQMEREERQQAGAPPRPGG